MPGKFSPGRCQLRCWCAALLLTLLPTVLAPGQAFAQALKLTSLLQALKPDPACSQEQVVGLCQCGPLPCGLRVQRYVPVAVVEITRAPGDSVLSDGLGALAGAVPSLTRATISSALSDTDHTAEAHAWALPEGPIPGLPCLTCTAASAQVALTVRDPAAAVCGPAAVVAQALAGAAAAVAGPWVPRLVYASELDALNWRTGCRDLASPSMSAALALPACARGAGPLCLGSWGLLVPRQMRDVGPSAVLYAAKTAVRALSIAREQLGTLPYPVDTAGKLQQIHPARSACFAVGQWPLASGPGSDAPQPSKDGRSAWIYWRPTSCCVTGTPAAQCLRAP